MGKVERGITDVTNIRRGNTSLSKIYRGQSLIWQPAAPAPSYVTTNLYVYVDPFAGFDGTTITDLSPTPKTITRGNSITTTGAIGGTGGWNLNATSPSSKYFYFNNPITSATSYSYEIFFKINSWVTFNNEPNMLAVLNGNFDTRFGMKGNGESNKCFAQAQDQVGNSIDSRSSTSMIDNTWHQWVYTYNTSTRLVSLYKDATLIDSDTLPGSGNNFASGTVNTYCMGPINASFLWGFNGALGGLVRVYTSELSSAEVTQNYNANKADYGL